MHPSCPLTLKSNSSFWTVSLQFSNQAEKECSDLLLHHKHLHKHYYLTESCQLELIKISDLISEFILLPLFGWLGSEYNCLVFFFLSENVIRDGLLLHFVSSMISGFVTTVFSMPVDIVKTR